MVFNMLTQWVFAYKYWTLSYRIRSIVSRDVSQNFKVQRRVNYCFIFNMIFWQALGATAYIVCKLVTSPFVWNFLLFFSYWTFLVISLGSLFVLWNSFRRITAFSTSQNLVVNTLMIRLHLVAYVFFIISFLFLLIANIVSNSKLLSAFTMLVAIANLVSELILVFIFTSIFESRVTKHKIKTA